MTIEILEKLNQGLSPTLVSQKLNIRKSDVDNYIKTTNWQLPSKQYSLDDNNTIKELYANGTSTVTLAKMFNVSKGKIQRFLKNENIELRDQYIRVNNYSINENFFDLNSEERDYWLGYLSQKCTFQELKNSSNINILEQETSLNFLNKFLNSISYKGDSIISRGGKKNSNYIWLEIDNLNFINCLNKYITKNKNTREINLTKDSIRGLLDGKGNIHKHLPEFNIYIYSNKNQLNNIKNYFKNININCYVSKDKLSISGNNQIEMALSHLYENATIYHEHNYNIYKDFLNYRK